MAHVSKGVATEEEWGAGPAPKEAAEQADRPASAGDIRIDICVDLEQAGIVMGLENHLKCS